MALTVVAIGLITFFGNWHRASALPSYQQNCSMCHGALNVFTNTVTATPSASTIAPGGAYTVAISMSPAVAGTGYWIANSDAIGTTGTSTGVYAGGAGLSTNGNWTANMTAPITPGTYYYKVFGQSGPANATGSPGFTTYSIVVGVPTTPTPPINLPNKSYLPALFR